ncbi:MAG: hypothetical protein JXA90_16350 [Planctomycetes bacterium]|nr:hypothetical protein [Planctomycetota bacterium]
MASEDEKIEPDSRERAAPVGHRSRGWRVAIIAAILGTAVLIAFLWAYREPILDRLWPGQERPLPQAPGSAGAKVTITSGSIGEFASFLQDSTGLPAMVDGEVAGRAIEVSTTIEDADAELVRALLESKGLEVCRERLPGGREILRIRGRSDSSQ